MIAKRTIELIHGEIDGVNAPAESTELRKIVAGDRAASEFQQDMQRLAGALDGVEELESPAGLRDSILAGVGAHSTPLPLRFRKPVGSAAAGFRIAAALAAGLVVGLFLGPRLVQDEASWNPAELGGAMMPEQETAELSLEIRHETLTGSIRATREEDRLVLSFDLSSGAPVEVALAYDRAKAGFMGFERTKGAFDAQLREGRFVVTGSGDLGGTLVLQSTDHSATTVRLEYRRDGALLGSEALDLDAWK